MTELKQALLMAISALKQSKPSPREGDDDYVEQGHREHFASLAALQEELEKLGEKRMTTLREAAQRALKSLEDAIKMWTEEMEFRSCVDASDEWLESYAALREALREALAPVPVAWMDREGDLYKMPEIEGWAPPHTLLYTHPPYRKPLTNEELDALAIDEDGLPNSHFEFARAIELAHGIGEKK